MRLPGAMNWHIKGLWQLIFVLLAISILPINARSEEVIYNKHTVVDFGDDTIEGDLSKPDQQYLESRKRLKHQRLIKVRQSFRVELLQSVRSLHSVK